MSGKLTSRLADGCICTLYYETEINNFDTQNKGVKTYDRILYATIIPPGGGNNEQVIEVKRIFGNEERKERINPLIYDRISHLVDKYEKNAESGLQIEGTPIEDVSFIHPNLVGVMKMKNIHTVEILADVPDSALSGLGMDGRELREKARYYLEQQKSNAPMLALAEQKQAMEKQMDEFRTIIAKQNEMIASLSNKKSAKE